VCHLAIAELGLDTQKTYLNFTLTFAVAATIIVLRLNYESDYIIVIHQLLPTSLEGH
jgi:hypothetical protein